jgi:hypothetical protein
MDPGCRDSRAKQGHQQAREVYTCDAVSSTVPITSCTGPVSEGNAIDTAALGLHRFAVTATDVTGMTGGATVQYRVTDQTRPRLRRLHITPSAIDATEARAFATVRFKLSKVAQVLAGVSPAAGSDARTSRVRGRVISCRAGANSFRLRRRIGRRVLPGGAYRLTLVRAVRKNAPPRDANRAWNVRPGRRMARPILATSSPGGADAWSGPASRHRRRGRSRRIAASTCMRCSASSSAAVRSSWRRESSRRSTVQERRCEHAAERW